MPRKPPKVQNTDNSKQLAKETKRKNRLNSIKNELENAKISSFEQIFAILSETALSQELGISYHSFRIKWNDPSEFTIGEIMKFASLVGVTYDIAHHFVLERIKAKSKSKIFRQ